MAGNPNLNSKREPPGATSKPLSGLKSLATNTLNPTPSPFQAQWPYLAATLFRGHPAPRRSSDTLCSGSSCSRRTLLNGDRGFCWSSCEVLRTLGVSSSECSWAFLGCRWGFGAITLRGLGMGPRYTVRSLCAILPEIPQDSLGEWQTNFTHSCNTLHGLCGTLWGCAAIQHNNPTPRVEKQKIKMDRCGPHQSF